MFCCRKKLRVEEEEKVIVVDLRGSLEKQV
jgi:hypothetical protein